MSTQDTAALVESVNKMTETVAGKIGEIDKKVDDLLGETSNVINSFLSLHIYVSVSGSDSDLGSASSPLKTIEKAMSIIPEGATARVYLISAAEGSDRNVYDVVGHHDLGSRNVIFAARGGSNIALRFMNGGIFTTRTGGSLKIGNPNSLTIEVDENRTSDTLVNMCGGMASFGGFYTTYLVNNSPSLKSLCRVNFHVGDYMYGSTFGGASFMRLNLTGSTETDFNLCDVVLGGMMFISIYSVVLSGNMTIFNPARRVLNIDSANTGLVLTY